MQIQELKAGVYNILTEELNYTVVDTANDNITYPWVRISTSNLRRVPYKKKSFEYEVSFVIEIFSNYNGEAEVLKMEKEIYDVMPLLYNINGVVNVSGASARFMDDKSLGPMGKHAHIIYTIKVAGEE